MTKASLFLLVALSGCGNFSNEDLEYLNALPVKEDLAAKLPETQGSALTGAAQVERQPLLVGERAPLYQQTRKASDDFNGLLDGLLSLLEAIRQYPPTQRTDSSRTWGPVLDRQHPAYDVQLVIERTAEAFFTYRLELRRRSGGEWFAVLAGDFRASGGIRVGKGHLELRARVARDNGLAAPDLSALDTLSVDYATEGFPVAVDMNLALSGSSRLSGLGYRYREQEDGSGAMRFESVTAEGSVEVLTRWLPSGAGRADARVLSGPYVGMTHVECWDPTYGVSFSRRSWAPLQQVGLEASCVDVSRLAP